MVIIMVSTKSLSIALLATVPRHKNKNRQERKSMTALKNMNFFLLQSNKQYWIAKFHDFELQRMFTKFHLLF